MSIVVFDGNEYSLEHFCSVFASQNPEPATCLTNQHFYDYITNDKFPIEDDKIIAVNVHHPRLCNETLLQKAEGVEFIKYLRLLGKNNPIIAYSFYGVNERLAKVPEDFILLSPGVTYLQLPFFIYESKSTEKVENGNAEKEKQVTEDEEEAKVKAAINSFSKKIISKATYIPKKEELIPFFKVGFELPTDERHNWANWWGVRQLWLVHRCLDLKYEEELPEVIQNKMTNLNSQIAIYIHGKELDKVLEERRERLIESLNMKCEAIAKIEENGDYIKKIISECNDKKNELEKLKEKIKEKKSQAEFIKPKIEELNNEVKELNEFQNYIDQQIKEFTLKGEEYAGQFDETIKKNINNNAIVKEIKNSKLHILHIDDQVNEGWGQILTKILNPSSYSTCIKSEEINFNSTLDYDLILLDLRLNPVEDAKLDVSSFKNVSGVKILKKIRKIDRFTPILMFSATNKSWKIELLKKWRADDFWTKEGIDNRFKYIDSELNYKELLKKIKHLSSGRYVSLKNTYKKLISFHFKYDASEKDVWWQKHEFSTGNMNVINMPENRFNAIKKLAIKVLENYRSNINQNSNLNYMSLFIQVGYIIEGIHSEGKSIDGEKINEDSLSNLLKDRGDWLAYILWLFRNAAAHYESYKINYSFNKEFKLFFDYFEKWFLGKEFFEIYEPKVSIKRDFRSLFNYLEKLNANYKSIGKYIID